ncbi:MAG: peptide ABC transporter substrate-binding protein [Acidimicrobiia bacterium]
MKTAIISRKFAIVFLLIAAIVLAGCSSSSDKDKVSKGGTITIGAEQEPDCLDFVGSCSGSSWGFWMVAVNTLPRAYSAERIGTKNEWEWKHTNLLAKDAELETSPVQKITYTINKDAVWSDGKPITGDDFVYTWDQVANGEDVYDKTGYTNIDKVEVNKDDNKVVVVTMKKGEPYAGWKALFGGNYGILPSHILKGKDRNAEMKDGYTFSGGPFKLVENGWKKGETITIVRNDKYWGEKAKLDKVIFRMQSDTTAEFASFKTGEVLAIYPQPQIDVVDAINEGNLEGEKIVNATTGSTEALWINNEAKPFDSKEVRQALGYSLDRDAIVNSLFGDIGVKKAVNSFVAPAVSQYAETSGFSKYKTNKSKVDELLTKAGYAKNSSGVYAKGGQELSFTIQTTEGNQRRKLTLETMQKQLQDLGWKVEIKFVPAGDLFGTIGPKGEFQVALYAQILTVLDPANCSLFCSENIPTAANGDSGNNWTRTRIDAADVELRKVDRELDEDKRIAASKKSEKLLAEDATSIPLDPLPNIFLWSNKLAGNIDENPIQGPFWTLSQWGLK